MTETVEEYGVRWHARDFASIDTYNTEADARAFATLINPTGDARTEIVSRTVTHTDWTPIDQLATPARE